MTADYDLVVIGGGINGAGTARDAAGRGLKTLLAEKDDLAQGTSSRSGKYIHGGLRYLEHYEFRLVREALRERDVILNAVPHLAWPIRLILLHAPQQRPRWLIGLGLFLYDHLGGRSRIPMTQALRLNREPEGSRVNSAYRHAFAYHDVWVDDARLVILNARDAAQRGAEILTRTAVTALNREGANWRVSLQGDSGQCDVSARAVFNASGPWVEQVISSAREVTSSKRIRLVKGSHLIMDRWWDGEHGYVLQAPDNRLIFVNPYFDNLALVGTTDIPYSGRPEDVEADTAETTYLLNILNMYFTHPLSEKDIRASYSGVRPLFDDDAAKDASTVTRDYSFELDGGAGKAPLLSAFGGKLTTYRKLSEAALHKLRPYFPDMGPDWTSDIALPGGEMSDADFNAWFTRFRADFPCLPDVLARHYARNYGTESRRLLHDVSSIADLGHHFGGHLYAREVDWLRRYEWAQTADDILFRRTKHHLFMSPAEQDRFATWLNAYLSDRAQMSASEPDGKECSDPVSESPR